MTTLPTTKAADLQPYAFLAARPNPVGVGQTVMIVMWLDLVPGFAYPGSATATWKDYTLTIMKPDGSNETMVMDSDPVASQYVSYAPTVTGNYTLQFYYPGETVSSSNTTMLPALSPAFKLVVQEEPISGWPSAPLPSEYWTRPINGQNREWYAIANNWYGVPNGFTSTWAGSSNWVPNGTAPDSGHILWSKEKALGGLVGGELADTGYYSGASYEDQFTPPVILDGKLYYNMRLGSSSDLGLECVDLATGEELWFQNGTTISCGQSLEFDSPNQHGAFSYLWQLPSAFAFGPAAYKLIDAYTGTEILEIVNAQAGNIRFDEQGDMLVYVLDGIANRLLLWNSTKCILTGAPVSPFDNPGWSWRPTGGLRIDWAAGIEWNVSVPDVPGFQSVASMGQHVIIAAASPAQGIIGVTGYSTEDGSQLWNFNITSNEYAGFFFTSEVDNKFAWFQQEKMEWYGYDAQTGKQLWGPTDPYSSAWGMYTSSSNGLGAASPVVAYGKLYAVAYDGMIHCYDMTTGHNDWNYYIGNAGFETPYGTWPLAGGLHVAADGKIYVTTGEHSPNYPLTRGEKIVCVNATTGDEIWRLSGWMHTPVIADGSLVAFNEYDNRVYCIGKGPTAVTVSAPDVQVTASTAVLIKGTVSDISPGTQQNEQAKRFPNGVPVVSDDSESQWMEYVYEQQPRPTNATGVPVTIDVLDSNGNYRNIGKTTSDANGFYSFEWMPDIPGKFTVIASFAGSEAYWPSHAETAFSVSESAPTQAPTQQPTSIADIYFVPAIAGLFVLIIIVLALVVVLMLRKRP